MLKKDEETGKKVRVVDHNGVEFDLTEFREILEEQDDEIEGRTFLVTPGGLEVDQVRGEEGSYIIQGTGEVLTSRSRS